MTMTPAIHRWNERGWQDSSSNIRREWEREDTDQLRLVKNKVMLQRWKLATVMVPLIYEIHLMIRCNSRFANSRAETLSVKGMESVVGNSVYKWIETMCVQASRYFVK